MSSQHPATLDTRKAAERIGISRSKFYEFIRSGEIATIKIGARRLVRVETLNAWLAAKEKVAAPANVT